MRDDNTALWKRALVVVVASASSAGESRNFAICSRRSFPNAVLRVKTKVYSPTTLQSVAFFIIKISSFLQPQIHHSSSQPPLALLGAVAAVVGVGLDPLHEPRDSRVNSREVFPRAPVAPGHDSDQHEALVGPLHDQRTATVALAGVAFTDSGVTGAQHVLGDHLAGVVGVGHALLVGDDGHLDLLQDARRLAVLLQRAPARGDRLDAHELLRHFWKTSRRRLEGKQLHG